MKNSTVNFLDLAPVYPRKLLVLPKTSYLTKFEDFFSLILGFSKKGQTRSKVPFDSFVGNSNTRRDLSCNKVSILFAVPKVAIMLYSLS